MKMPDEYRDSLLAPIPGAKATGEEIRYHPVFHNLYAEIEGARPKNESQAGGSNESLNVKRADWAHVEQLCIAVLQTRSKHLDVVAWLTEAWTLLHGFPGLRAGLELLVALCNDYWDDLYPSLDDIEKRLTPFEWIRNGKVFLLHVRQAPLMPLSTNASQRYSLFMLDVARQRERSRTDSGAASPTDGEQQMTVEEFNESLAQMPHSFFVELDNELLKALDAVNAIEHLLDERIFADRPDDRLSFRDLRKLIERARLEISSYLEADDDTKPDDDGSIEGGEDENAIGPDSKSELTDSGGKSSSADIGIESIVIRNREEAYELLAKVRKYLQRIEPHSPVPYLIGRAISWGDMPLSEVLKELLGGRNDLDSVYQLLGIRNESNEP